MPSALRVPELAASAFGEPKSSLSELPQFFRRIAQYRQEFIVFDDGFRGWTFGYEDIARLSRSFAVRLRKQGICKGETVMIWSESRPGWIIAMWGCLLEGAVVVRVEPQCSLDLFHKVEQKVRPRLILLGDRVPDVSPPIPIWRLSEVEQSAKGAARTSGREENRAAPVLREFSGSTKQAQSEPTMLGMIAARLHLSVIPIRLRGVNRILPRHARRPHPGPVEIKLGSPICLQGESYSTLAQRVEEAVRNL